MEKQPSEVYKKRLFSKIHMKTPVNNAKFLKIPILKNIRVQLLLNTLLSSVHSFSDSYKVLLLTGELGPKNFNSLLQDHKNVIMTSPIRFYLVLQRYMKSIILSKLTFGLKGLNHFKINLSLKSYSVSCIILFHLDESPNHISIDLGGMCFICYTRC